MTNRLARFPDFKQKLMDFRFDLETNSNPPLPKTPLQPIVSAVLSSVIHEYLRVMLLSHVSHQPPTTVCLLFAISTHPQGGLCVGSRVEKQVVIYFYFF